MRLSRLCLALVAASSVHLLIFTSLFRAHDTNAPSPNAFIKGGRVPCALVSTSGALLASEDGQTIDSMPLVARLGQAPVGGAFAPHVGRRTAVRFVASSFFESTRHMNASAMHAELAALDGGSSEVVFLIAPLEVRWRAHAGCPSHICAFMRQHPGLPYRCTKLRAGPRSDPLSCEWPMEHASGRLSSGAQAVSLLFGAFGCSSIRLFGFENRDQSLPYHYWHDASVHAGTTIREWYEKRRDRHDFEAEHRVMHDVLGACSWELEAERYQHACRTDFAEWRRGGESGLVSGLCRAERRTGAAEQE